MLAATPILFIKTNTVLIQVHASLKCKVYDTISSCNVSKKKNISVSLTCTVTWQLMGFIYSSISCPLQNCVLKSQCSFVFHEDNIWLSSKINEN